MQRLSLCHLAQQRKLSSSVQKKVRIEELFLFNLRNLESKSRRIPVDVDMMLTLRPAFCTPSVSSPNVGLSRQHRAWVALYSLQTGFLSRREVLAQNNVTEDDLAANRSGWLRLQEQNALRRR